MFARITTSNGVNNPHFFSFRFLLHYSTNAHSMVDFLVNSLGFSKEDALTTSNKVTLSKPPQSPQSVINFFKINGFDSAQIKNIVSRSPNVLYSKLDKTLKPKLQFLQQYGLSRTDLVKFIVENEEFFRRGVATSVRPSFDYLRNLLGCDENVIKAVRRCSWLLSCNAPKIMAPNVALLQGIGFSDVKIRNFILLNPRLIMYKRGWLEDVVNRVKKDLGIPQESSMFFYGINAVIGLSQSDLAEKVEVYKSFGWPDAHIRIMVRKLPFCLSLQDVNIRKKLAFLMKEAGCTSEYLASHPALLLYSLEKRLIPRFMVLKILHDKHLKRSIGFYTAVCMKPSQFMKEILLPYKDEMPILFESYMKSV